MKLVLVRFHHAASIRTEMMISRALRSMKMMWEMERLEGLHNQMVHATRTAAAGTFLRVMADWAYQVCVKALLQWKEGARRAFDSGAAVWKESSSPA